MSQDPGLLTEYIEMNIEFLTSVGDKYMYRSNSNAMSGRLQ